MPNKIVRISLLIMVTSVILAAVAIMLTDLHFPKQSHGQLVFAKTYAQGVDLDKIIISSDEGDVTLLHEDNFWVVKEADYYYANIELINILIQDINNSTYYSHQQNTSQNLQDTGIDKGVRVRTYSNNTLLNDITVGKEAQNSNYHFVKDNSHNNIWLADGKYDLPTEFYSWIMQPISDIPPEIIEKININNNIISRDNPSMPFITTDKKIVQAGVLLDNASYVVALNVLSAQNFAPELYPEQKTIYFTTFPGLVVGYHIYSDGKEYWLNMSLTTTPLPKQYVNAYIKENQIFYDGWYFEIPATQGKILSKTFMHSNNNGISEQ